MTIYFQTSLSAIRPPYTAFSRSLPVASLDTLADSLHRSLDNRILQSMYLLRVRNGGSLPGTEVSETEVLGWQKYLGKLIAWAMKAFYMPRVVSHNPL